MAKLSIEELLKQLSEYDAREIARVDQELPRIKKKVKTSAVRSATHLIDETLKEYGVTINDYIEYKEKYKRSKDDHEEESKTEIKNEPKPAVKVEPKYFNPKNPEQTWTGRGIMPSWVREAAAEANKTVDVYIKTINIEKGLNETIEQMPMKHSIEEARQGN